MWIYNYDITLEDVSNYAPSGVNWRDHYNGFFQYQTWNNSAEQAWVFRIGKHRLMLVKEKPSLIDVNQEAKSDFDKAA